MPVCVCEHEAGGGRAVWNGVILSLPGRQRGCLFILRVHSIRGAREGERQAGRCYASHLPLPESGKPRSHTETLTSACERSGVPSAFQFPSADWR